VKENPNSVYHFCSKTPKKNEDILKGKTSTAVPLPVEEQKVDILIPHSFILVENDP